MRKFLLDAQLPRRLISLFREFGLEAIHTLDLPDSNRTPDRDLIVLCEHEDRILVTKDHDFVESYLLSHKPEKLLLLSCGNFSNPELERLLRANLERVATEL